MPPRSARRDPTVHRSGRAEICRRRHEHPGRPVRRRLDASHAQPRAHGDHVERDRETDRPRRSAGDNPRTNSKRAEVVPRPRPRSAPRRRARHRAHPASSPARGPPRRARRRPSRCRSQQVLRRRRRGARPRSRAAGRPRSGRRGCARQPPRGSGTALHDRGETEPREAGRARPGRRVHSLAEPATRGPSTAIARTVCFARTPAWSTRAAELPARRSAAAQAQPAMRTSIPGAYAPAVLCSCISFMHDQDTSAHRGRGRPRLPQLQPRLPRPRGVRGGRLHGDADSRTSRAASTRPSSPASSIRTGSRSRPRTSSRR